MKRKVLMLIGVLGLGISIAQSQTNINSWENTLEGWTVVNNTNFASGGFSTTDGVTDGTYSWGVTNTTASFKWNQDGSEPDLQGPSSTGLTALLANARKVQIDAYARDDFGWGFMVNLCVNQPGGAGNQAFTNPAAWSYQGSGTAQTCTFTLSPSLRAALQANPSLASSLSICMGAGSSAPAVAFFDYLRIWPLQLVYSWENDLEGWTVVNNTNFTSVGFSTTNGVTAGKYSWGVQNTTGSYKWNQDGSEPDLQGPASTELTAMLANAASVTVDCYARDDFGWGFMVNLCINQPGGAGNLAFTNPATWSYQGGSNTAQTCTFTLSQAVRTALLNNSSLPCSLSICMGAGNSAPATVFIDKIWINQLPPTAANLWVRELWDDIGTTELLPANTSVGDNTSSVGFDAASSWLVNPNEVTNCRIMAFRPGFANDALSGASTMCLPTTLDGSGGVMVQENSGFDFFPVGAAGSFWTAGDFMTRQLTPGNYINFQAEGEYWFSMTIANAPTSLNGQWVTFPASGWLGLGFANGSTTNADFVAIGVTGFDVYLGPTNSSLYHGDTNVTKALYISQGTLGQPGDTNTQIYNPLVDPSPDPTEPAPPYNQLYSQTNFSGGPYCIKAYSADSVGKINGDYITLLGRLKVNGDGTATINAKYYGTGIGGNSWNTELDMTTNSIQWDCNYSFAFGGTMTKMLLFENGQFPCYVFGIRASKNFQDVVGFDPGRISVAPLANTYEGYPIYMTNLAVKANAYSWGTAPSGYGTTAYQWYQNGVPLVEATNRELIIASAALTNAGTYMCVATDGSGTWAPVTNSTAVTVTYLPPPTVTGVGSLHNGSTFVVYLDEPNLTGVDDTNHFVFSGGVGVAGMTAINTGTRTEVQIRTTDLPEGTRITLTVSGITNVVGGVLATTNITFWTDLIQTGYANWNCWLCPNLQNNGYWPTWLPANPNPTIVQSMLLTSWEGPTSGVTNIGANGYAGNNYGANLTGWFVPPVTTNYVFFCYADDGARLSLSTNSSSANLFVIACESDWSDVDTWTNINTQYGQYGTGPHRGDGTATGTNASPPYTPTGYVWDNSVSGQSPATACLQNRSDQFIVAYYDSTGEPGGPPGATNIWTVAESKVEFCVPVGMTNFWPNRDGNGQALIHLEAGQKYFMKLEFLQNGGGYPHGATYKIAGETGPLGPSIMTGANIAGLAPFVPTIAINETGGVPQVAYTGVLFAGTTPNGVTNQIAISSNGVSYYNPPNTNSCMFYRTGK